MQTRRDFVKKAALLSGAAGIWSAFPESLQRALAIEPEAGSTYLDAEHVVILMQENRSFDHCYGTLQGVRGFNDRRAMKQPNGNPVWMQSNAAGETYAPFRLNIKESNATWLGSLPHSWTNQVDARNGGQYDKWLIAKPAGRKEIREMPLTLGFYNRQDIPFYYALADSFTVCDQHFCSSLTGTTPNRLYLWTGTVREKPDASAFANVRNEEVDYGREASWTTFPERLEDHGISWKIYQNELSLPVGFAGEEEDWLANFTDNPIEWFTQYQVRFSPGHRNHLEKRAVALRAEVEKLQQAATQSGPSSEAAQQLTAKQEELQKAEAARTQWSKENFEKLSPRERNLHEKAFCTNTGDPHYHELDTLTYKDGDKERTVKVPKGDIFHQFRTDVKEGKLPKVSWLVAPSNFSDHPGSAWYGAWYVSETLDILTQNPEVWKKTIFILTYDENDGYYDHVPPFVPPHPKKTDTGLVSKGIDTSIEYVELEQDLKRKPAREARESPIGLGYRVPLVIASPWSRGGAVCSQVFDHTSSLQFLEKWLSHKTGKKVEEPNISAWRRTVCGDLTSVFQPYQGEKIAVPSFLERDAVVEGIHRAQFQKLPSGFKGFTPTEIAKAREGALVSEFLPTQEKGKRRSSALPYELSAQGGLTTDRSRFALQLAAGNEIFGNKAVGSPFIVYARPRANEMMVRNYAVSAGDRLEDTWSLSDFEQGKYHLEVYGPNGFFREFRGGGNDPKVEVRLEYRRTKPGARALNGEVALVLVNHDKTATHTIELRETTYRKADKKMTLRPGSTGTIRIGTDSSFGWYDFLIGIAGQDVFTQHYAGRVETGKWSYSDPAMG
jgi:phospholipase C